MQKRNRGRWSALVIALAMLLPTVGTAVAHADTPTTGKVQIASQIAQGSGTMPVFIQTTSKSALSVSGSKSPSAFKGKKTLQETAKDTAEKADDTSQDVLGELKKLDPKATSLYTTAYTVPGIAVYADAAALRKLAEQSDSVSKLIRLVSKRLRTALKIRKARQLQTAKTPQRLVAQQVTHPPLMVIPRPKVIPKQTVLIRILLTQIHLIRSTLIRQVSNPIRTPLRKMHRIHQIVRLKALRQRIPVLALL